MNTTTQALKPLPAGELPVTDISVSAAERPRGRNVRWLIVGIIVLITITNYVDRQTVSVAAPLISKDLGLSNTQMGFIFAAFLWSYTLMNLPCGWLIDRFGTKTVLSASAIGWSLFAAATGLANSVAAFVSLRLGLGLSEAPMFPAAAKATTAWFPKHERASATSFFIAATQFGLAITPPIATALILAYGWHSMFITLGLISLIPVALWLLVYREPGSHSWVSQAELDYIRFDRSGTAPPQVGQQSRVSGAEWRGMFRHRSMWIMMTGSFCLNYFFYLFIAWLPTYLVHEQGVTIQRAGILAALPYIAGIAGVLLGGRISDFMVRRGVLPMTARRTTVACGAVLTAIAMFATSFSTTPAVAITFLTIGMFTFSLTPAAYWSLPSEVVETPRLVASVASVQNFGGSMGGAISPILTGIIVDRTGSFQLALLVAGVLVLISAVLYGFVLRRRMPI